MQKRYFLVTNIFLTIVSSILLQHSMQAINLSSFWTPPTKRVAKTAPRNQVNLLLTDILAQQENPDYLAALKILSNKEYKKSYRDNLVSIDFFFLGYTTTVLHKYSVSDIKKLATQKQQPINLTEYLSTVVPVPKHGEQHQFFNLLEYLQISSKLPAQTTAKTRSINLSEYLSDSKVVPVQHSSVNLSGLSTSES